MGSAGQEKIKVVIIGGGISGLALGAGLAKKPHIDFHIYESVPEYKDVGAGLALHLNAIKAMTLIGDEVRQKYSEKALSMGEEDLEMATQVILAQGPNEGELVAELGRAKGRKTVARHELMKGLLELLPPGSVTFGKRAASVEQREDIVKVNFRDGEEVEADCVLGADGVHSVTRAYILGPDHPAVGAKNHEGYQNYRRTLPMDRAKEYGLDPKWVTLVPIFCGKWLTQKKESANAHSSIFLGPHGYINSMPLNKSQTLSVGVCIGGLRFEADKTGGAPPLDTSKYDDYSDEVKKMIRMIADDPADSWSYADHDHAPFYWRGRVCMIGDAAHTMHPFAGNGAAQALEDCAVIDYLFSKVTSKDRIEKAFAAFDHSRRPRSQAVVDISRKFGRIYGYAEGDLHADPARMKAVMREAGGFTNNVDLAKQNEDAMKIFESSL